MTALLALDAILDSTVGAGTKGLPPLAAPLRVADLGARGWNILRQDTGFPVAVLHAEALRHNSDVMRRFVAEGGALLCPHGKTTMAPQLFELQLQDGAWGITAATPAHLMTYRRVGVPRIFYANQLIDRATIDFVLAELARDPNFDFYCLIDSGPSLARLVEATARHPTTRPLQVLVELGLAGGRTGARSVAQALDLARQALVAPGIALRGVEAFEGILSLTGDSAAAARIDALLTDMRTLAEGIAALRAEVSRTAPDEPILLSAGGSAFFERVMDRLAADLPFPTQVILRSGCYLTHDHGLYQQALADPQRPRGEVALAAPLRPALEVWALVQSCPEPGLAIATLGKRDISHDIHPPRAIHWFRPGLHDAPQPLPAGVSVRALNDQHAYLALPPEQSLAVGDLVGFGVSHPCTTFDKWPLLLLVDGAYNVTGGIRTFF